MTQHIDEETVAMMAATLLAGEETLSVEDAVAQARELVAEVEKTTPQPGAGPWTMEELRDVQTDSRSVDPKPAA